MEPTDKAPEAEILLGMVTDLRRELDRYLTGASLPSDAASHILETCKQMRTREMNGALHYWLGAIEYHARQIGNPPKRSGTDGESRAPGSLLGIQLLKDIDHLRAHLTGARSGVH